MTSAPQVWGDALRLLQDEIPDFAFEAWIAPLAVKIGETRVVLGCPTSFHRERVRVHFFAAIERCWRTAWDAHPRSTTSDGEQAMPTVAAVDMAEFATVAGSRIEVRLPVRRSERSVMAAGARLDARCVEPAVQAAAGSGHVVRESGPACSVPPSDPSSTNARETSRGTAGSPRVADVDPTSAVLRVVLPARARGPKATSEALARRGSPSDGGSGDWLQIDRHPPQDERAPLGVDGGPAQGELPFSFESFVVGPCNALAREAALALARRRQSGLNQLYLGGESGMGKTHLARAAAAEARRQGPAFPFPGPDGRTPDAAIRGSGPIGGAARLPTSARAIARPGAARGVVYTTAEQFTSEFVSSLRSGRAEEFQKRYRAPIGLLIVEDVQFFDGRMKTQLELFHTVQHVLDAGGRVLLTGDRAPRDLKGLSDRVRAQFVRGFVAELERPDAIVRRHILRSKAAAGGVHLPADCLDLRVEATGGSVRDVESVLIQVVTTASLLGRPIDLALTRESIDRKAGGASPLAPRRVAPSEIVRIVAAFFGKRPESLAARSRRRDVLLPRQLAMYLAHRYTDASFAEIGRSVGRDHPSVRNAIGRIERLVLENVPLRYQVEALSERVDQTLARPAPAPSGGDR